MNRQNVTCVQRSRFFFYFFEEGEWKRGEKAPLEAFAKSKTAEPEKLRALGDYLQRRLTRIAGMIELLIKAHDDWAVTTKKDCILLETETWDFNQALDLLKRHGFSDDEFVLKVEYSRKWGIL